MGLINSIGYGMVKAAEVAQPFLLQMHQADIQEARDRKLLELAAEARKKAGKELSAEQAAILKPREDQIARNLEEAGGNAAARDFVKNESGIDDKERAQAGAQAASKLGLIEQQGMLENQVRHIDQKEHEERRDKNQEKHYQNEEKRLERAAELTDIQIKAAKLTYDRAQQESKIAPADKLRFDSLAKAYESTTKSINDAMAKNEFDANSENGKALLAEQSKLAASMAEIMATYSSKSDVKSSEKGKVDIDLKQFDKSMAKNNSGKGSAATTAPVNTTSSNRTSTSTLSLQEIQSRLAENNAKLNTSYINESAKSKLRMENEYLMKERDRLAGIKHEPTSMLGVM